MNDDYDDFLPMSPNNLYFLMGMECYAGYELTGLCNSEDTAMPRGAIMGGAVVAALSSWRDRGIIDMFGPLDFFP